MLWALVGCDSGGERTEYANEGEVCLKIAEDGRLQARVNFRVCLSSSCDRALETSCALGVSDGKIVVTSQGASETTGESSCTDDCGGLSAECRTDGAVSAGSYELSHGQDEATAELGSEEFCFGDR